MRRAEFSPGQSEDRLNWLTLVRQAAERNVFAWAYWAFRGFGGMALADDAPAHALYAPDLEALGLAAAD